MTRGMHDFVASVAVGLTAEIAGHCLHMLFDTFHGRPAVQMLWLAAGLLVALAHLSLNTGRQQLRGTGHAGPIIQREVIV